MAHGNANSTKKTDSFVFAVHLVNGQSRTNLSGKFYSRRDMNEYRTESTVHNVFYGFGRISQPATVTWGRVTAPF